MTAAELVKALGGRGDSAPCPVTGHGRGRGDRNHSLSVHDGDDHRLLARCHAGCSQADVWEALQDLGLVGHGKRSRRRDLSNTSHDGMHSDGQSDETCRRRQALVIWEASVPALHTPAQDYLACRGIVIQPPAGIRYNADKHMLVALVQAVDGAFAGIQRIYLKTNSRGTWKTGRYSLGPIKGGAVRLTPAAESLQLTESVEDALALLQMTGRPTWAVPGAGFIPTFEPPPEVTELVLAPDHDAAGLQAIERVKVADLPLKLRQLLPPPGKDWCDVLENHDECIAIQEEPKASQSWVERFCNGL